jgi:hypothetical protein
MLKLEDLTQDTLNHLVACTQQRSVFAATVAGIMALPVQSKEALDIKRRMMMAVQTGLEMGLRVGDFIEKETLMTMKNHCEEQLAMEELIDSIKP